MFAQLGEDVHMTNDDQVAAALATISAISSYPIRPDVADYEDVPPYIIYQEVSQPNGGYTLTGLASLNLSRYQIDVYSLTRSEAARLADAICVGLYTAIGAVKHSRSSHYDASTHLRRVTLDFYMWLPNT